jgi:predicted amidohydrolase YtcJ
MEWIVGGGWDMSWFPDGLSLASVLDRVMPDRPAVFRRVDGHAVVSHHHHPPPRSCCHHRVLSHHTRHATHATQWANTAAMKAIDVYHKDFPDPPHGRIDKDPHTGLPIGSFQEQVMPFRLRSLSPSASDHSPCGDQTRYRPEICFRSTSRRSPWRPVSRRWSSA